jgi:hypothetical protein
MWQREEVINILASSSLGKQAMINVLSDSVIRKGVVEMFL